MLALIYEVGLIKAKSGSIDIPRDFSLMDNTIQVGPEITNPLTAPPPSQEPPTSAERGNGERSSCQLASN